MKKVAETIFVCSNCGNEYGKWQGQCSGCKEWNSLKEITNSKLRITNSGKRQTKVEVVNLGKMASGKGNNQSVFSSEIGEFDRVLGKGIVRGQVVLFAGEPGIGKSTLLTQLVGKIGGLYVAGEESAEQIRIRVRRLGLSEEKFDVLETNSIENIVEVLERTKDVYKVVVVDSIQVMSTAEMPGGAGSPGQIRESAFRLIEVAKKNGMAMVIVGHVTKEGEIAGPKLLEHMVDTVLYFEGDKNSDLRILRVTKNRFGPTDEVGIFSMVDSGLIDRRNNNFTEGGTEKIGSAITVVMEGTRPMVVEIQALVTESFGTMPKRVFSGIDYNRGQLLVAVAQKVLSMPLYKYDVFVAVTGGIRIEDTGVDLAVVGAMYSSFKNEPIQKLNIKNPPVGRAGQNLNQNSKPSRQLVLMGEVSLLGEVKRVKNWDKRVREAEGLGREVVNMGSIREFKA